MDKLIPFLIAAILIFPGPAVGACAKSKPESTPTSRFVLKDGEAFDQKTKLTWERCSVGTSWNGSKCVGSVRLMSLDEAKKLAGKRGGGWRVPTIEELYSIVESRCTDPTVNSQVFPGVRNLGEGAPYWSTTRIREMPPLVYFIDFVNGEADGHTKGFAMAVRLVRNGR